MRTLYATRANTTYETFEAECPSCANWNVFNRTTDLGGARGIDFRVVVCQAPQCQRQFAINGDSADPPFAQVLASAYDYMQRKRYGDVAITVARSYEMFFLHCLEEHLAWKRFRSDRIDHDELPQLNATLDQLRNTITTWTFAKLRRVFINIVLECGVLDTLDAGTTVVAKVKTFDRTPDAGAIQRSQVRRALERLLTSNAGALRNRVVHKDGYCPSEQEARQVLDECEDVLWTLADELNVRFESYPAMWIDDV